MAYNTPGPQNKHVSRVAIITFFQSMFVNNRTDKGGKIKAKINNNKNNNCSSFTFINFCDLELYLIL